MSKGRFAGRCRAGLNVLLLEREDGTMSFHLVFGNGRVVSPEGYSDLHEVRTTVTSIKRYIDENDVYYDPELLLPKARAEQEHGLPENQPATPAEIAEPDGEGESPV